MIGLGALLSALFFLIEQISWVECRDRRAIGSCCSLSSALREVVIILVGFFVSLSWAWENLGIVEGLHRDGGCGSRSDW